MVAVQLSQSKGELLVNMKESLDFSLLYWTLELGTYTGRLHCSKRYAKYSHGKAKLLEIERGFFACCSEPEKWKICREFLTVPRIWKLKTRLCPHWNWAHFPSEKRLWNSKFSIWICSTMLFKHKTKIAQKSEIEGVGKYQKTVNIFMWNFLEILSLVLHISNHKPH